jgi:hypothetical protein
VKGVEKATERGKADCLMVADSQGGLASSEQRMHGSHGEPARLRVLPAGGMHRTRQGKKGEEREALNGKPREERHLH